MFQAVKRDPEILMRQFIKGVARINGYLRSCGRDAYIAAEIENFEREVMGPMDAAWAGLDEADRIIIFNRIKEGK